MDGSSEEMILAQEQGVINRGVGMVRSIEGAFEVKETEGTLILTSSRIIYARGNVTESIRISEFGIPGLTPAAKSIAYVDADDIGEIPSDPANIWIDLKRVSSVRGTKRIGQSPKLEVEWNDGTPKRTEFIQQVTGASRRKNLNDWATVIDNLREGTQQILQLPPVPDESTLAGRIYRVLCDYEERGPLTLELEVEKRYDVELEPEEVQQACAALASAGLVSKQTPRGEEPFYVKVSPLGADNLEA